MSKVFYTLKEIEKKFENIIENYSLNNDQLFNQELNSEFFENSLFQEKKKMKKMICARSIVEEELCFCCWDCSNEQDNHMICDSCFFNGNHRNHRVIYCYNIGCCDCGDAIIIKKESFCKNHSGFTEKFIFEPDTNIQNLFCALFDVILSQIFFDIESEKKCSNFILTFLKFLEDKIEENCLYIYYISNCLIKNTPMHKKLSHNCDNNYQIEIKDEKSLCKCSFLTNIFRFNPYFSEEIVSFIHSFFIKLYENYEFKKELSLVGSRMINFIFYKDPNIENILISNLLQIYDQFSTAEIQKFFISDEFLMQYANKFSEIIILKDQNYSLLIKWFSIAFYWNEEILIKNFQSCNFIIQIQKVINESTSLIKAMTFSDFDDYYIPKINFLLECFAYFYNNLLKLINNQLNPLILKLLNQNFSFKSSPENFFGNSFRFISLIVAGLLPSLTINKIIEQIHPELKNFNIKSIYSDLFDSFIQLNEKNKEFFKFLNILN